MCVCVCVCECAKIEAWVRSAFAFQNNHSHLKVKNVLSPCNITVFNFLNICVNLQQRKSDYWIVFNMPYSSVWNKHQRIPHISQLRSIWKSDVQDIARYNNYLQQICTKEKFYSLNLKNDVVLASVSKYECT